MRDNTLIDKIARTIHRNELGKGGIEPLPFIYATFDTQNIMLDQVVPPFCACSPIESAAVVDDHGLYHDQVTLVLLFGDLMCEPIGDFDAVANERIIDECKQRAFIWLASLKNNPEIELVSINASAREYLRNDSVATGYSLNVTIKEIQGYGRCQI